MGYEFYLNKKYPDRFKRTVVEQNVPASNDGFSKQSADALVASGEGSSLQAAGDVQLEQADALSQEELMIENADVRYQFNQRGTLDSIVLKDYQNEERSGPMEILSAPLRIVGTTNNTRPVLPSILSAERQGNNLSFRYMRGYWEITQVFTMPENGYGADVEITWKNTADASLELTSSVMMSEKTLFLKKSGSFLPGMPTGRPAVVTSVSGKTEWEDAQKYCEDTKSEDLIAKNMQEVSFVGFDKHYFLQALLPLGKKSSLNVSRDDVLMDQSCNLTHWMSLNQGSVDASASVSMKFKAWFGPKSTDLMEAYDVRLKESLDLGMFSAISRPLFVALQFIQNMVGNWGLTIIILTILLKILFYPLTRQAAIAQNKMKKLQPEMNKIKEKFKDDPRRQQQEIMQFMSSNKVNPMKGCFPILPQIPVFIAFYRVLSTSIELRQAPFFLWISDLSVQDPYFITPVLLGVTMLIQQKLMPTTGMDKTQERIMMMLPLIFTVMMLTLPAGMVLYMLANTLMSIGQQQWLNRKLA